MSDTPEDRQHAVDASGSKPYLDSLPIELVLKIYGALEGANRVETMRHLNRLRSADGRLYSMMADQKHALGRYQATMNAAADSTSTLYRSVYPKDGLSNESHYVGRHVRGPTAAEQIAMFGPVLDLLPKDIQSDIVTDIVDPKSELAEEHQTRAIREMSGFLDKLRSGDDVRRITDKAISYFTREGHLYEHSRREGAYAIAMAGDSLSDEQEETLQQAIDKRPELDTLFAAAVVTMDPRRLKNREVLDWVLREKPQMHEFDQRTTAAELLEHLDKFDEDIRTEFIQDALGHLERYPNFEIDPSTHAVDEHYEAANLLCTKLAKVQARLSEDMLVRLDNIVAIDGEIGLCWEKAKLSATSLNKHRSAKSSHVLAREMPTRADARKLALSSDAVTRLQALPPRQQIAEGTEIVKNIVQEVQVAAVAAKVAARDYDDRRRIDADRSR